MSEQILISLLRGRVLSEHVAGVGKKVMSVCFYGFAGDGKEIL
jgi:hypothetical protein